MRSAAMSSLTTLIDAQTLWASRRHAGSSPKSSLHCLALPRTSLLKGCGACCCMQTGDGYGHVAYAEAFPQEVGAILVELDNWITGERRDLPSALLGP